MGPSLSEYLPDQLHPNGDGYKILADNESLVALCF